MSRHDWTDSDDHSRAGYLPPECSGKGGRSWNSHRQVIKGTFSVLPTGMVWLDLPAESGKPRTVCNRFLTQVKAGTSGTLCGKLSLSGG